ncbi:DUF1403 family protein [Nitratireductor kimnyeongensis]|uniref:DUF1403 family protein n=1 Tax=Nitratireductor kimnyeongensis TaxID=430679 RepID=A0ABW0TDM6_9HYPH|nr:DUF1403 family protein [Nitratireductor kimnyeongensis]QZZ37653.1 DUF1403 family protein [Nitratireductor kimnyeongensis]
MDPSSSAPPSNLFLPQWTMPRTANPHLSDAAFAAGIALKTLDDLVRSEPAWSGCWRARQALKCAAAASRLMGRGESEVGLRDAVLLTSVGDDPGPAGKIFLAHRRLASRRFAVSSSSIAEVAGLLGLGNDAGIEVVADHAESVLQSGRAAPFAAAELVQRIMRERADAEPLAWALADGLIAAMLGWPRPVPLLMAERYGRAFRAGGDRGRIDPSDAEFSGAVCLALVRGTEGALRSAGDISRRADTLVSVLPKLRTKGAGTVVQHLLDEDALPASAPGCNLSRWASKRLFERLEHFGAVRELSGRSSFRIFGL